MELNFWKEPFQQKPQVFDHIISLGQSCQVAYQLGRLGLRFEAYPFDWLFSFDTNKLIEALESRFTDWLKFDNLVECSPQSNSLHKIVIDSKYGMTHQHIFPLSVSLSESYSVVKEVVNRRVKRLLDLYGSGQNILFIRTNLTFEEGVRLSKVLSRIFGENVILLGVSLQKDVFRLHEMGYTGNYYYCKIYDCGYNSPGDRWQGHDQHWSMLLRNIQTRYVEVDLAKDNYFQNVYPPEFEKASSKKAFRWLKNNSKLELEEFVGSFCKLYLSCPVKIPIQVLDIFGNPIFEASQFGEFQCSFAITHQTHQLSFHIPDMWRPCDLMGTEDSRALGVCLKRICIERQL